jgi:hypothetical protein
MAADLLVKIALVGPHGLLLARYRIHNESNRVHELRPPVALAYELGLSRRRQPVVLRPLIRFADSPFRFQPPAPHQTVQRRIERAGLDPHEVVRLRADGLADTVAVTRPHCRVRRMSMSSAP